MKELLMEFKKIDHLIINLIKSGVKFSFILMIFATLILLAYELIYMAPLVYYIGLSLFKTSLFFIVGFIICGLAFDKIIKDLR